MCALLANVWYGQQPLAVGLSLCWDATAAQGHKFHDLINGPASFVCVKRDGSRIQSLQAWLMGYAGLCDGFLDAHQSPQGIHSNILRVVHVCVSGFGCVAIELGPLWLCLRLAGVECKAV